MKILKCALLFLICLCSFNFSNGQNCQYLVGYWPLDTISYNDNINNGSGYPGLSSGYFNNSANSTSLYKCTPTQDKWGNNGYAYHLNSDSASKFTGSIDNAISNSSGYYYSLWINFDSINKPNSNIIGIGGIDYNILSITLSKDSLYLNLFGSFSSPETSISLDTILFNRWYNLVIYVRSTNFIFFKNDKEIKGGNTSIIGISNKFYIGEPQNENENFINAKIDNIEQYDSTSNIGNQLIDSIYNEKFQPFYHHIFDTINKNQIINYSLFIPDSSLYYSTIFNFCSINTSYTLKIDTISTLTNNINTTYNKSFSIDVFPNPNYGDFYINITPGDFWDLQIVDSIGRVVYVEIINSNESLIPINYMPSGTYFVRVFNDKNTFTKKIIVQ